jgi:hypothetical protein
MLATYIGLYKLGFLFEHVGQSLLNNTSTLSRCNRWNATVNVHASESSSSIPPEAGIRDFSVIQPLTVLERNVHENVEVFKAGNQPLLQNFIEIGAPTPNPLAVSLDSEVEMEAWFLENVDQQLLDTIHQIHAVELPSTFSFIF